MKELSVSFVPELTKLKKRTQDFKANLIFSESLQLALRPKEVFKYQAEQYCSSASTSCRIRAVNLYMTLKNYT